MDVKAEKLAQARRKLREFQSKHPRGREANSSPSPSVSSAADTNGRRSASSLHSGMSFSHDDKKSPFELVRTVSQSSHSSTTTPANMTVNIEDEEGSSLGLGTKSPSTQQSTPSAHEHSVDSSAIDYMVQQNGTAKPFTHQTEESVGMADALNEALVENNRLTVQLTELNGHYSEIYAAYTKLSGSMQSGGVESAANVQLAHLQTAMSVVVKEKTALQQQLRESADKNEQLSERIVEVETEVADKTGRWHKAESELNTARREIDSLNGLVQRGSIELDNCRREAATWQARVLHIQQDSNDAQERLKLVMKEAELAQTELVEARKQLHLKDIYLRQSGVYNAGPALSQDDIQSLQGEKERLTVEVSRLENEKEQLRQEARAAREHYESYGAQLNQNVVQMSAKLEDVCNERLSLQSKLQMAEDELEVVRTEERQRNQRRGSNERNVMIEVMGLRKELGDANYEVADLKTRLEESSELVNRKDSEVIQLTQTLQNMECELSAKVASLTKAEDALVRSQQDNQRNEQFGQGVRCITDQLQNEKATVSRAVAQNHELKDQLLELQDRLVTLSQESMDRESGRLTALHTVEQLQGELERLKWSQMESAQETDSNQVNNAEQHSVPQSTMEESSEAVVEPCDDALARSEEARILAEEELSRLTDRLTQLRSDHRRVTQENQELRRIMEQNAEDENQNNIHVELGQAVERINALSGENVRLRDRISELEESDTDDEHSHAMNSDGTCPRAVYAETNGSMRYPSTTPNTNCERVQDDRLEGMPAIAEKPVAWTELEARFARAMTQNADLVEQNERLEHVILQLQSENDTIGEYVTIYHHQRKILRDRMREKQECVARLSHDKEQMQEKLSELQSTLMKVLTKKGILHNYQVDKLQRKRRDIPGAIVKRANQLRSFSHSTVDELSGDEETVVDGSQEVIPETATEAISSQSSSSITSAIDSTTQELDTGDLTSKSASLRGDEIAEDADEGLGVQRILNLIAELQKTEQGRPLPPCDPKMHCRECRGKLITL